MKKMFTYILKDKKLNIYKIGKTTNPPNRFRALCKLPEIVPIALIDADYESVLHEMFDSNRIILNDKVDSGKTEWFKSGGKFDEFIDDMDQTLTLPYMSPHILIDKLESVGKFKVYGYNSDWKFSQIDVGRYMVGTRVLEALNVIKNGIVLPDFEKYVDTFNSKVILNEEVIKYIVDNYDVGITEKGNEAIFNDIKDEKSIITNIKFKKEKTIFIILIKNSIIKKENYF